MAWSEISQFIHEVKDWSTIPLFIKKNVYRHYNSENDNEKREHLRVEKQLEEKRLKMINWWSKFKLGLGDVIVAQLKEYNVLI